MQLPYELWSDLAGSLSAHGQQSIVLAALSTLLVILLTTRTLSGSAASSGSDGARKSPPVSSHWLPWVGNTPSMYIGRERFLAGLRNRYDGIFSFTMLGKTHHFIYKPSLVTAAFNLQRPLKEDQRSLMDAFGLPDKDYDVYERMQEDVRAQYKHLTSEPGLGEITSTTLRMIRQQITDLVTFNSYPADQADWERVADADVLEDADGKGGSVVEVDFMGLVRNFVAKTAAPAVFGTDFAENFADIFELNWVFDQAVVPMGAGFPSWIPFPRLQRGKLARRKMHAYMQEFHEALEKHLDGQDPGARWQDLDNVSRLVKGRAEVFRKNGLSLDARAALDVSLLWAMTTNSNPLIAWMLFETYRDPVLLEQIREEIAPYVRAVQPRNDFGPAVWVSPELQEVDVEGLLTKCPRLMSAYVETLRLYTSVSTTQWMLDDTVLQGEGESYLLRKGSCIHLPLELHQYDPAYFPDRLEWRSDRHITENGHGTLTAEMGTIRPYGGGNKVCKGIEFALRELLLYASAIITFYDVQPAKGGSWETPGTVKYAGTRYPKKPIRVWVKRREAPPEKENAKQGLE